MPNPSFAAALAHSRYLSRLAEAQPELAQAAESAWQAPFTSQTLERWLAQQEISADTLKSLLRRMKQYGYLQVAARDLAGVAALQEVTEGMTLLAERAISLALQVLTPTLAERHGLPVNAAGEVQELIVIGMGKLGGRELNVSSDIDLIFVYPDDGETNGAKPISNFEFSAAWAASSSMRLPISPSTGRSSASICVCARMVTPVPWCAVTRCWKTTLLPRGANGSVMPGSRRGH